MKKLKLNLKLNKEKMKEEWKEIITLDFKFFESTKKTFENLWFTLAVVLLFIFFLLIVGPKNYYNNHSDDVIQYFTITENYFLRLKNLDFSFFNLNNYFGASIYSDAYYVPVDIFTLFTFLFSFIFEFDFVFGFTELLKIFCGTMMFAYCLYLKKNTNKSIFMTSLIYMCSGMFVCLMAFPAYLSMIFYLPLGYYCTILFFRDKKMYLPIYVMLILFYNFYVAYTLIWFIGFAFLLEFFQRDYLDWKKKTLQFFTNGIHFVGLILIGVLMGCVILYPAAMFILNNTERMDSSHNLFKFEFFQYVRLVAKVFSPSLPTGFYGFGNSYVREHLGFNMTIVGLISLLSIFKYRDKISKTFQVALIVEVLFLLVPVFYMVFSFNELPYTRWISGIMFINLLALGHTLSKNNLKIDLHSKYNLGIYGILMIGLSFVIGVYAFQLSGSTKFWARDVLTVEFIYFIVVFIVMILVFSLHKVINLVPILLIVEIITSIIFMFSVSYAPFNKIQYDKVRNELNDYLDQTFEKETDDFYRIFIDYKTLEKRMPNSLAMGEKFNFNRTNTHLTNFRFFHSFYDKTTNDFSRYLFDDVGYQTQKYADNSNIYFNYLFTQKYLVTNSQYRINPEDDCLVYLDPNYFQMLKNENQSQYDTYQLSKPLDFIVYDQYIKEEDIKYSSVPLSRMKAMLENAVIKEEKSELVYGKVRDEIYLVNSQSKKPNAELVNFRGANYYAFDLSSYKTLMEEPSYLYYSYRKDIEIEEALFLDTDGNEKKCLSNVCYYNQPIEKLYVKISGDVASAMTQSNMLKLYFDNYDLIERFLNKQNESYLNKKLKMGRDQFSVKFDKKDLKDTIVYLPITYSENFTVDKGYETININGGFLGIKIPKDVQNVDFTVTYKEVNFYTGLKISLVGFIAFGEYVAITQYVKKKRHVKEVKQNEEH